MSKKRQREQKDLNINDITISSRAKMPKYEECMSLINPQGLDPEALSYSEKVFLDFCVMYEKYDQKIKEAVKQW